MFPVPKKMKKMMTNTVSGKRRETRTRIFPLMLYTV